MVIIGNYEAIKKIGEGGFGRTYEARHIVLGTKACLKQNINISAEDEELLRSEARLLWHIHHHSLPTMKDYFQAEDGSYILAMSFIEGKPLDHTVKKHKAIHPEDVSWVTQRLLNALNYLHYHGVVHGDVKPPNIIVQPWEHNAFLVDFGLSSVKPTAGTSAKGYTAVFAAPEVMDKKPPIPASDLYGLGMTMIYALGGDPLSKSFPDHVPEPLQEFYSDLVRHNPADRPDPQEKDLVARLSDLRHEVFGRKHTR